MRTVHWRLMVVLAVAARGLVANGVADDTFPPCWRGGPGTTFQEWEFTTAANPAFPVALNNPYGTPSAAITVAPGGGGWINTLNPPFGVTRSGFWDLGPAGNIALTIPNGGPLAGSWKFLHVQVTQYRDGIYSANATVSIPGATLLRTQTRTNQLLGAPFNGWWELQHTVWLLEPCPASETITVTAPASGAAIDQIVVDTQCSTGDSGDITVPCWRGQPGSTYQNWSFHRNTDPTSPEQENNPGAPMADIFTGPLSFGWQDGLTGFGCRQGYWDLGSSGSITMTVPNTAGSPTSYKIIQVQVTEFRDSLAYTALASVNIPGATLLSRSQTDPIETTLTGRWVVDRSVWRISPCPASETVVVTAPSGGALVDQVVVDTLCLEVACPPDVGPLSADSGQCSRAAVSWPLPPVDGCKVTAVTCVPSSGSTFPVGVSPVACTVQDASGGSFTCNFNVTITDNEPPQAHCPANVTVFRTMPLCASNVTFSATASDNCPGVAVACLPPSGSAFPLGVNTVNCTATDAGLLTGTCSFTVTVLDFTGDAAAPCWRGQAGSTYQYWSFLSGASLLAPDVASSPGSPLAQIITGPLALGWQNGLPGFSCRQGYWDLGASGTISLFVPNLAGSPSSFKYIRVQITRFKDGLAYVNPLTVALPGATIVSQQQIATLDSATLGAWVVDETILRLAPCPASETILLTAPPTSALVDGVVVDTLCQDFTCPTDITGVADPGQCSKAGITWSLPAANGCTVTALTCLTNGVATSSPGTFPVGVTTVMCTLTDAEGGTVNCNFTVTITDTQPPSITCPPDITIQCPASTDPMVNPSVGVATATDNCSATVTYTDVEVPGMCPGTKTVTRTWKATDGAGLMASCVQVVNVVDTVPPTAGMGSIAACYPDVASAEAAALAATTASDNCGTPAKSVATVGTCSATITVTVTDSCNNTATAVYMTRIDNEAPVIGSISAAQTRPPFGVVDVKNCANPVLADTVYLSVAVTDNCGLSGAPTIVLVNGMATENATLVNESPAGTYNYTWPVTTMTANGTWTATVTAADCANNATATFTLCVNKRQITGQVELEGFSGAMRAVTFVATDGPGAGATVLKTWTLNLNFSGGVASYLLTDVPPGTAGLSAKTAWTLRRKQGVTLDVNGQGVANFTGVNLLKGGDLSGDNQVSLPDYSILAANWFTMNPVADITGDGVVNLLDYTILGANWFTAGDPE